MTNAKYLRCIVAASISNDEIKLEYIFAWVTSRTGGVMAYSQRSNTVDRNFLWSIFQRYSEFVSGKTCVQIDFSTGNLFLHVGGGGGGGGGCIKNVSQILAIDFSSREIDGKTLSVRKNIKGNINLGQTSRLNLDRFGISNDIPDCRSAPYVYT